MPSTRDWRKPVLMQTNDASFLALGSNLSAGYGSSVDLIRAAIAAIGVSRVRIDKCSSFYQTRPLGPAQPEFINLVLKIHTLLAPRALLHHMQGVETAFGRQRQVKWGPRTLDIDILSMPSGPYGPDPLLPHGELHKRGFVLYPLSEIAPGWVHPVSLQPISALIRALPASERVGITRL